VEVVFRPLVVGHHDLFGGQLAINTEIGAHVGSDALEDSLQTRKVSPVGPPQVKGPKGRSGPPRTTFWNPPSRQRAE
jgi:hypothetical protein